MSRQPPADIVRAARTAHAAWPIPISVQLAQWIVESNWGAQMPPDSNNPFGETTFDSKVKHVTTLSWEHVGGVWKKMPRMFIAYPSIPTAFERHAHHLWTSEHYTFARKVLPDPFAYVDAIAPIYATGPAYATSLKSLIRSQGLTAYDQAVAHA